MITFMDVVGNVYVDDGVSQTAATNGMYVDPTPRTCVVVALEGSRASLDVNRSRLEIGGQTWLNVTAGIPRRSRSFLVAGFDYRLMLGRLWAHCNRWPHFEEDWNDAMGIRG